MAIARQRRAVSEGSMSQMVGGNLGTERIRRGGKGRGERDRADKGGGGGSGKFAGGKEGIRRRDLEGGRGGASGHVGKSNVSGLQRCYISKCNQIGTASSVS